MLVLHGLAIGLDDRAELLLRLAELFLIDALEPVGIVAVEEDAAGKDLGLVLPARLGVVRELRERLEALVAVADLGQRLVVPFNDDGFRLALVALLHDHLHKFGLVKTGGDEDLLSSLDIGPLLGDQARVGAKFAFVHALSPLYLMLRKV